MPHLLETVTGLAERQIGFRSLTEAIDPTDRVLEVGFAPSVTLSPLLARSGPRSLERWR